MQACSTQLRVKFMQLIAANGKNLTKVIKQEANVEKKALNVVIQELADLQRMQKEAVKVSARPSTYHPHS